MGALPHPPLKELFAKSSLRILKKLYKKYSASFSYVLVFSQTVNLRVSRK